MSTFQFRHSYIPYQDGSQFVAGSHVLLSRGLPFRPYFERAVTDHGLPPIVTVLPALPVSARQAAQSIKFRSTWNKDLGKKGKKDGIRLSIDIEKEAKNGIEVDDLKDLFGKVGKGLYQLDWKVEANVH